MCCRGGLLRLRVVGVWLVGVGLVCLGAIAARADAPVITSFKPASGPVGTQIKVKGKNFLDPLTVIFTGGVYGTGAFSDDELAVTVPPGAETGPFVINSNGASVSSGEPFVVTASTSTPTPTPTPVSTPTPTPAPTPNPAYVPVITSGTTASGTRNEPFTFQITADRLVSAYYADGLPSGLQLDSTSGVISGRSGEFGKFMVELSAAVAGYTGHATLTLTIANDAPTLTVSAVPSRINVADGQKGKFVFSLSHRATHDVTVYFSHAGPGIYYVNGGISQFSVVIPAGQTRATLKVRPTDNTTSPIYPTSPPAGSVLWVRIEPSDSPDDDYIVGTPKSPKIKLVEP